MNTKTKAALTRATRKLANGASVADLTPLEAEAYGAHLRTQNDAQPARPSRAVRKAPPMPKRRIVPAADEKRPSSPPPAPKRTLPAPAVAGELKQAQAALAAERKRAEKLEKALKRYTAETMPLALVAERHQQGQALCASTVKAATDAGNIAAQAIFAEALSWHGVSIRLLPFREKRGGGMTVLPGAAKQAYVYCPTVDTPQGQEHQSDGMLAVYVVTGTDDEGAPIVRNEPLYMAPRELWATSTDVHGDYVPSHVDADPAEYDPIPELIAKLSG